MIRIEINDLRKSVSDLLEEHAPGKLGGMFCECSLCKKGGKLLADLDANRDGYLVLEHGKKETTEEVTVTNEGVQKKSDSERYIKTHAFCKFCQEWHPINPDGETFSCPKR